MSGRAADAALKTHAPDQCDTRDARYPRHAALRRVTPETCGTRIRWVALAHREARGAPCLEAADEIGRARQAQLTQ